MSKIDDLPQLRTKDIEKLLGDQMPVLSASPVGRLRLLGALKNKLGQNFKSNQRARTILKDFDEVLGDRRNILLQRKVARG